MIKTCSQIDGQKSWQPRNMDSSGTRLTDRLEVGIKRHISPNTSLHPRASLLWPGAILRTCAIDWITPQDNLDRSTDDGGVPQHMTMTVIPDTLTANPAGPNITSHTQLDCVAT